MQKSECRGGAFTPEGGIILQSETPGGGGGGLTPGDYRLRDSTLADADTTLERCPDGCSCRSLWNRAEISPKIRHQSSSSNNSSEIDRTKAYAC